MTRPARPEDLYRFRIPTDPRISPDGSRVVFTLQSAAPRGDGYRHAVWGVPADGSEPARPLAATGQHDRGARFSPDGRRLAFISDRKRPDSDDATAASAPGTAKDASQIHVLPLDGGEAVRLTNFERSVEAFEWSPDGSRLVAVVGEGARAAPAARGEDAPPPSDYRYIDRLKYMMNGEGFRHDRVLQLWLVDAATGEARRLTRGRVDIASPAWSPDGTRIAYASERGRDTDLTEHSQLTVVDVASGRETAVTSGDPALFTLPTWLPDGRTIAAIGHRYPARGGSRQDLWLFAADGSDATPKGGRNLTGHADLMLGAGMVSDLTPGEEVRLRVSPDGRLITFLAPDRGSYDAWRVRVDDCRIERLTAGRHQVSSFDQVALPRGGTRLALIRSDPTNPSEVEVLDLSGRGAPTPAAHGRRVTELNREALEGLALVEPQERWTEVDGRRIHGWYFPAAGGDGTRGHARPAPLVTQIHGGPHACYGWSPVWEFQVLAGAGIAVYSSNPRGSDGYGQDFNAANYRDWTDGPMRDLLAGVDALVDEGLADPERLGLTGGSYGGYLTNWIVAHDQRFAAALTARSVCDMTMLMLTGDISGAEFGRQEFGVAPWEDPDYYRSISPLTYATNIRTPLLIQHSEQDIRTTVGQAEALFTVLRSLRRPVRLMRVPEENHELTRSGTPFRRVENLVQVRDWFRHYLVRGRRGLPPAPGTGRRRAGAPD